ncbi:glycosyltransferase [Tessaracoccus sp. G1721]
MSEPTVLWVTPVSNLAGVARHILDVARVGLPGWRLVVTAPEGPLLERLRELDCPVIPLSVDGVSTAKSVAALRQTLKRLRPAVAHSHLAKADILLALAAVGLPVTLVTTEHCIPHDRFMYNTSLPGALAMETVHRLRLTRVAQALAVSEATKRDMLRHWPTKTPIAVVLNGVDRPTDQPMRRPGLRMLSLTRLSPEKNLEMTLRVFALVVGLHPDATLTLAGTGPDEDRLRGLAASLGIADTVSFPGFVDPGLAMESHDVVLQPSRSDNLSYTLLDAVARGLGVAASPVGGNPEILPTRCIAELDDDAGMARIAIEQGLHPELRPSLPDAVPTVRGMACQVSHFYDLLAPSGIDGSSRATQVTR